MMLKIRWIYKGGNVHNEIFSAIKNETLKFIGKYMKLEKDDFGWSNPDPEWQM